MLPNGEEKGAHFDTSSTFIAFKTAMDFIAFYNGGRWKLCIRPSSTDPAAVFKCYVCLLVPVAIQGIDSTFLGLLGWTGTALWCSLASCSWRKSHLNDLTWQVCQGGKDTPLYLTIPVQLFEWCDTSVLRMTDSCHAAEMFMWGTFSTSLWGFFASSHCSGGEMDYPCRAWRSVAALHCSEWPQELVWTSACS